VQRTIKQINSAKEPIIYCNPQELQGYIFGVYETVTMGAKSDERTMPLFAAPPEIESTRQMIMPELLEKMGWVRKKEWVGLTDEERHDIREWQRIQEELGPVWSPMMLYLYEAIEAKLREKNT